MHRQMYPWIGRGFRLALAASASGRLLVCGFVLSASLLAGATNLAWTQTTYTWKFSDQDGAWTDPNNWDPSGYPNASDHIAKFTLGLTAHRTIAIGQDLTVNQIVATNTSNSYRLYLGSSGSPYTLTLAGTKPVLDVGFYAGGDPGIWFYPRVNISTNVEKKSSGTIGFFGGVIGSGDITLTAGSIEMRGNSPNYSGNLIVNGGSLLQARSSNQYVLGDTTGKTIINQGWFWFRDLSSYTCAEPFELNGVHSRGAIRCYNSNVTLTGTITLNANGTFSVADWASGGDGQTRTFTINSTLSGSGKNVYFLGDYYDSSGRYPNARKNVIVLGAQNTYGGNTYITSNYHDAANPFTGNVRLAVNNALPTTTKLILGGQHNAATTGTVNIGIPEGNGKLILNGFSQELAGLETAGTGTANRVVGGSTTTSTLTLNIADGVTNTYGGYLGGPDTNEDNLALVKTGLGTLVLTAANTYTGTTTVNQGVLRITHASALGASGSGQGTTVADGARLEVSGGITVAEPITITGVGGSDYNGALRSTDGNNTWSGPITTNGARIGVTSANTFTLTGGITGTWIGITGWANGTVKITTNPVNLSGEFRVYDNTTALIEVTGNSWTNTPIRYGGTVKLGVDNALPSTTVVSLGDTDNSNGTLDLNGRSQTIAGLIDAGTGTRRVINSAAAASTLTIQNTSNYTFGGVIQDNINLVKKGSATFTLSGINTYTGTTTVEAGTLALVSTTSNNNISGSSVIRVGTGATLNVTGLDGPAGQDTLVLASGQTLEGNGTVQGNVEAPVGSFLAAGMSPGKLTITGHYTQGGTLVVELAGYQQGGTQEAPGQWQTNGYDWVSVGGSAVLDGYVDIRLLAGFQPQSGDVFNVLTAANGITDQGLDLIWQAGSLLPAQYWTYRIVSGQGTEQILQLQLAVPEPASLVLLVIGAAALWLARRLFARVTPAVSR